VTVTSQRDGFLNFKEEVLMTTIVQELHALVGEEWERIKSGRFGRRVMEAPVTLGMYRDFLFQIYHYTRHNSMNQAAAAFVEAPEQLLKFVYRHAAEELGHERMVLHDLRALGAFGDGDVIPPPNPATEALIGYLYFVALRYGPIPRLGYSFWAEGSYGHFGEMLAKTKRDLSLESKHMTFFSSHAQADTEHMEQVTEAVQRFVQTPEQQRLVKAVARTTLFLTGQILEQVAMDHCSPNQ
jgi:thiaminase